MTQPSTLTGDALYDSILQAVHEWLGTYPVGQKPINIEESAILGATIRKNVIKAQRDQLGNFIRCSDRNCVNGEFEGKAEERGWGRYSRYWFCLNHKE